IRDFHVTEVQTCALPIFEAAPVQHIGNILVVWRPRREDTTPKGPATKAEARGSKRPSVAKSARAFAAQARRTALIQAAAEKKRKIGRASCRERGEIAADA